jgi:hypothetical protein
MELKEIDVNLQTMMLQNVPSIELNRRLLQNEINSRRVADIIVQASLPDSVPNLFAGLSAANSTVPLLPSNHTITDRHHVDYHFKNSKFDSESSSDGDDLTKQTRISENQVEHRFTSSSQTIASVQTDSGTFVVSDINKMADSNSNGSHVDNSSVTSSVRQFDVITPLLQELVGKRQVTLPNAADVGTPVTSLPNVTASSVGSQFPRNLYCPAVPPGLKGQIFIDFEHKHDYTETDIQQQNPGLQAGGISRPTGCVARHKVAIIVPYRDRQTHLTILLSHLHPMLRRQQLDYRIYVVEQYGDHTFNKARIMNIAFVEALKQYNFQCFVFHDVDLVPEDDRNMYSCPTQPRHMSVAIDEMGYKLAYQELVGGVLNMRTEHFQRVNGYSNLYWGWGAEDDDMAYRIMYVGLKITRPPENIARYKMIKHTKRKPSDWRKRTKLLYTGTRRFQFDGLNSLQYRLIHIVNTALYTHILVDIGKPPKGF